MFRKLMKNKKAQNTAEYALLISLVVAAIIAMQTYAQRSLQARIRDAGNYLVRQTTALGSTAQYEPYYLTTNYLVTRNSSETEIQNINTVAMNVVSNRTRGTGGFQQSTYNFTGATTAP
jgi:Flp pilus assembly pilin Flp